MNTAVWTACGTMFKNIRPRRNYLLFFGGQLVSQAGSWIQRVVQIWFVFDATHSGSALGFLIVCQFAPYAVFGLFDGVICSRLDSYRTLIVTQAMMILCAGILTVLTFGGSLVVWEVDAIAAAQGLIMIVDTPVRQAFIIRLVGREQLPNAIALNVLALDMARMLGPAFGAVAIASIGLKVGSLANTLGFVTMLVGLLLMRTRELHRPEPHVGVEVQVEAVLRSMIEGLRLVWRTRQMMTIMGMVFVAAALGTSLNVTLPIVVRNALHGSPEILGVLFACFGAGAVVGTLYVAILGQASWTVLLGACGVLGALELLLALQGTVVGCAVILVCIGVAFSCFTSNASATLQLCIPELFRARIMLIYSYSWIGIAPLGGLLAGWLSDRGGPALVFAVTGAALAVLAARAALGRRDKVAGEIFTLQLSGPNAGGELTVAGNGQAGISDR